MEPYEINLVGVSKICDFVFIWEVGDIRYLLSQLLNYYFFI